MKTTSNYGLKKPDGNDVVNIEDFNYNADIVDRKIKDVETKTNSIKVPVTSVNNKTGNVVLAAEDIRTRIGKSVESKFDDITKSIETVKSSKVDKVLGKGLSTQDYTTAEKQKLSAIASGANRYTHPNTHPATIISQDATHRFVSDSEKNNWNGKASRSHRHSSADINQDSSHRFVTDSDKASWNSKANVYKGELNLYVDGEHGNDNNSGTDSRNQLKTINKAISIIQEKEIISGNCFINITPGAYGECLVIKNNLCRGSIFIKSTQLDSIPVTSSQKQTININTATKNKMVQVTSALISNTSSTVVFQGILFNELNSNEYSKSENYVPTSSYGHVSSLVKISNSSVTLFKCGIKQGALMSQSEYSYGVYCASQANVVVRSCEIGPVEAKILGVGIRSDNRSDVFAMYDGYYRVKDYELLADGGDILNFRWSCSHKLRTSINSGLGTIRQVE